MRILFHTERDFEEILRETGLKKIDLLNTIQYLRHNRLIKKEMKEKTPVYSLTQRGENRLAFYEYVYQIYLQWSPIWAREGGWLEQYCSEMTDLIKKLDYFGHENIVK